MAGQRIADRADALAKGSGLYRLTLIDAQRNPRPRRWLSIVVVAGIIGGYGWTAAVLRQPHGLLLPALIAPVVFMLAFCAAQYLRWAGPRLAPLNGDSLDERELAIRARAGSLSGLAITILAVLLCFYQATALMLGWWHPQSPVDWLYLGLAIEALAISLPVLFASWMMPAVPLDADI